MSDDPFRYHPGLRPLILDPEKSELRDIDIAALLARSPDRSLIDTLLPDEVREAGRLALLKDRRDDDLWVFAYGSLMWDPAILFTEVRLGFAPHHRRRFILTDIRGPRGSAERPGVMAALDVSPPGGPGCHGLAFRIARAQVEAETRRLWARERIGPAYREAMIEVRLSDRTVEAVAFLADYASDNIAPDLPHETQVAYAATGEGFRGSSFDYVDNLVRHFRELGIEDAELFEFYRDVCARRDAQ